MDLKLELEEVDVDEDTGEFVYTISADGKTSEVRENIEDVLEIRLEGGELAGVEVSDGTLTITGDGEKVQIPLAELTGVIEDD